MQTRDFAVFLELWNMTQRYIMPSVHYRMAMWLQDCWDRGERRLLLMAFRACGKSTIVGLFSAWLLWRDPDLRILVLAADQSLAVKMVRNIRRIIERHPLTTPLIPKKADQWASDRFTIQREKELRDPSVLAAGVTTNITGNRADIIIYDDVEVPNTSDTPQKREDLRERLAEGNFILTPDGTQLYIGTPHTYFSIYADEPRQEINEDSAYLAEFARYMLPILNEQGESAWPEQYSLEDVERLRKQAGPHKFESQMMLQPKNIMEGRLDSALLQFYNDNLCYSEAQQKPYLSIGVNKIVSCRAWWDPSFASGKGDDSVLAIIFSDEVGNYYLHDLTYIQVKCQTGEDEASLQCQKVAERLKEFYVPSVTIEINGLGKFLPAILRRELGKANIPCAVVEHSSHRPKHIRIIEAFDAIMAARALHVHESVRDTPFMGEVMEWQPDKNHLHDDGLDAVAGALSSEPIRIKRYYAHAMRKWNMTGGHHQAKTDFDV